jgi:glucose-1-phosphate thymidylyltransferase
MKGVILAGGTGSRLYPNTKVINKHLLPVFDRPMIYYSIDVLKKSGINDILIITNTEHLSNFMELLGSGREFNVSLTYKVQDGVGGIADALSLAETFSAKESIAVILADNIFEDSFEGDVLHFTRGAHIFVKKVSDPGQFGVMELRSDGTIRSLEEKPILVKSDLAITGFYLYDNQVFDFIKEIEPSARGELEITDVNNLYLNKEDLNYSTIPGKWIDAGTHESILKAGNLVKNDFAVNNQKITAKNINKENVSPKIVAGLLTYNSEKYVKKSLKSLIDQDYENLEIVVLDNNSKDRTVEIIKQEFPTIKIIEGDNNIGFGAGHNKIINQFDSEFYACLNIDIIFAPNFISELVIAITEKQTYGSAGGKLKRWDFETEEKFNKDGKTNFIDSVGIKITAEHRFYDLGNGEVDHGQYDNERNIFGVSGAAVLFRRSALDDVAYNSNTEGEKEYFDSTMFMYKEDIDLSYRLQWAGWRCRYKPQAISYHDRTAFDKFSGKSPSIISSIKNRTSKEKYVNSNSYLNHQILLQKNFSNKFSFKIRLKTWWYNSKVFIYLLLFETETLVQRWKLRKIRGEILEKRHATPHRVDQKVIEEFME